MKQVGPLNIEDIKITTKIESYPEYPNVLTLHPSIDSFSSHNENIICIIDLAQQKFQLSNQSELNSYWWLSFKSYCKQCQSIFSKYLSISDKMEMDEEESQIDKISNIIFDYISGSQMNLSSDHHIAELFIETYFETDSLIAISTPTPKQEFDFLTFSDDNPYANIDKLNIDEKAKNDSSSQSTDDDKDDKQYKVEFLRANTTNNQLYKWYDIKMPNIVSPKTTSREKSETMYNDMMAHWECKLSQDLRYLIIFPQKLGEICDVYLNKTGKIYWIQSLNGEQNENNKPNFNLRRIFTFNQCDVIQQFKCNTLRFLVSTEEPARFKIMPSKHNQIVIWNFSVDGAIDDLYCVINTNDHASNPKLMDRMLGIDNAQTFSNYRFKDGNLKDLIRDVPKMCSLDGVIIFGGACFLSVLDDMDRIHVFDSEKDGGKRLISNDVAAGFCYDTSIPIQVCEAQDTSKWITDYIPFNIDKDKKYILARWQGNIGKSVYGVWKYNDMEKKWKCIQSNEYDAFKWNAATMPCYHFGDRIKTILLAIELQNTL